MIRVLFVLKFLKREIAQTLHPKAVLPIKLNRLPVQEDIQRQMTGFFLFYITILLFSALLVTMIEQDAGIGLVGTAATIGNIGPGFGEIGPMASFGNLSGITKAIFIFNMIIGRLELIPFLVMFSPEFWVLAKNQNADRFNGAQAISNLQENRFAVQQHSGQQFRLIRQWKEKAL